MYRCHLTKRGRIVYGENLNATTLVEAVTEAELLMAERSHADEPDGFEIWDGPSLLYASARG